MKVIAALITLALPLAVAAQSTPVGVWKTIDDKTGKARSLIRVVEVNGEIRGSIEKLMLDPGEEPNPRCIECKDDRKDKPVIGMQIMKSYRKDDNDPAKFVGGEILDPDNGTVYRSHLTVIEGGKKLVVRGYVGMPLFGRSQTWVRAE
jgi:uncharacterized protein (DUF2147 family)